MTTTFELPASAGSSSIPPTPGYDEARAVFNGMIDRRPALIARCANADDVVAAVNLAASRTCRCRSTAAATASPARRSSTTASASTCAA